MTVYLVIIEYELNDIEYHIFTDKEKAYKYAEINFGCIIEKEIE